MKFNNNAAIPDRWFIWPRRSHVWGIVTVEVVESSGCDCGVVITASCAVVAVLLARVEVLSKNKDWCVINKVTRMHDR